MPQYIELTDELKSLLDTYYQMQSDKHDFEKDGTLWESNIEEQMETQAEAIINYIGAAAGKLNNNQVIVSDKIKHMHDVGALAKKSNTELHYLKEMVEEAIDMKSGPQKQSVHIEGDSQTVFAMKNEHKKMLEVFDENTDYQLTTGSPAGVIFLSRNEFIRDYDPDEPYVLCDENGQKVEVKGNALKIDKGDEPSDNWMDFPSRIKV